MLDSGVMGWPESLNQNSTDAWKALISLPEMWQWLMRIFGEREDFIVGLVAYYMALKIYGVPLV